MRHVRGFICCIGCIAVFQTVSADNVDLKQTCTDLATGIGQFEKLKMVCPTTGTESRLWDTQIKRFHCNQVLGDDVLTQILNSAGNELARYLDASSPSQYCDSEGRALLERMQQPL